MSPPRRVPKHVAARRRAVVLLFTGLIVATVVVVSLSLAGGSVGGATGPGSLPASASRTTTTVPGALRLRLGIGQPSAHGATLASVRLPGRTVITLPKSGESAVYVPGLGVMAATRQTPRPMASVTKVMTAVVVLEDHPLAGSAGGPVFTMTEKDHLAWLNDSSRNDSNIIVTAGEQIDERQLLEALLVPSADNAADYLARWDAGSIPAFVAKMNAKAAALGLHNTHYADASGLDPHSVSTPVDQAVLAAYAMRNPVFRSIVDNSSVTIPVAGRVWNYNPAVGVDGIVGVKSGFTQSAQACLVTAAWRRVGGRKLLVVSAAFDQRLGLGEASQIDQQLLDEATAHLVARTLVPTGGSVGTASVAWSQAGAHLVVRGGPVSVVGWPGLAFSSALVQRSARSAEGGVAGGSVVATLAVTAPGGWCVRAAVAVDRPLPPESG